MNLLYIEDDMDTHSNTPHCSYAYQMHDLKKKKNSPMSQKYVDEKQITQKTLLESPDGFPVHSGIHHITRDVYVACSWTTINTAPYCLVKQQSMHLYKDTGIRNGTQNIRTNFTFSTTAGIMTRLPGRAENLL